MTASVQGDRVRCFTSTTGTGTVTVGSKYSNSFLTPAEAGIANNAQVTYALEEDGDFEIARGVYSTSGPTITRATVLVSSIGGTVGTSKMDLQGSAQIRIVLSAADINDILTTYAPLASPTFTGTPAAPTAAGGTNTTQIATTAFVKSEVDALVAAAPGALDTLDELAAALGDDPNFATTVTNALATKASLTGAETLTNKTLTAPKFADGGFIADSNGNELLIFDLVASAVNEITIGNAATGNKPYIAATGGDTNIGLDFLVKGTGKYNFKASASGPAEIRLFEDSDSGTNYIGVIAPSALSANRTITLPDTDDTLVGKATTDTLTNKRVTKRRGNTTSSATPTINTDNVDVYSLTAQTVAITSFTTNLSGTPAHGDSLIIEVTGTASRAITWGSSFEASGNVALPTTTSGTAMLTVGFLWNSATSKWRCVAVA